MNINEIDIEGTLDNFLGKIADYKIIKKNGYEEIEFSEHQANIGFAFGYSLDKELHPAKFEEIFDKSKITLKNLKGEECEIETNLDQDQIQHFKLLYYVCYISVFCPNKIKKFDIFKSKNLDEFFYKSKNEINIIFKSIKKSLLE